jgi:hypothetical protein
MKRGSKYCRHKIFYKSELEAGYHYRRERRTNFPFWAENGNFDLAKALGNDYNDTQTHQPRGLREVDG